MATPILDRIILEFAGRINDPVATAATNGKILTANERTLYVNKAMLKLINDVWMAVRGDKKEFLKIFPELASSRAATLSSSKYVIANPNMDFYTLVSGTVAGKLAAIADKDLYEVIQYGSPQRKGSADKPIIIEIDKTIYAFPAVSFSSSAITFLIIKQPLNPTDGSFLTQGGSYDSPFYNTWNSKIAEIAEQLFNEDAGNTA